MLRASGILLLAAMSLVAQRSETSVVYVSPQGNDANSGTSPDSAWQSLARVQRALDAGAPIEVRFERRGTWRGSLSVRNLSGPVRLTSYGEGADAILSGSRVLDKWESLGKGLWRTDCPACPATTNLLLRDGQPLGLARWPNADDADGGYLFYETAEGKTKITDEQLPSGVDWTGAEAVVRSAAWILDRVPVASQTGKTLTFASPATYDIPKGFGYFLQNHPAALDRDGEWVFDKAKRSITVLLNHGTPADHTFEVGVDDVVLTISRTTDVEIADISITGANRTNIDASNSANTALRRVTSTVSGDTRVRCLSCRDFLMQHSTIDGVLNQGLDVFECTGCRVERNRILNTATIAGMGRSGNSQYNGVRLGGTNAAFIANEVRRTGYLGIDVRGAAYIARNVISDFNLVKTDGGGIYTWGNRSVVIARNLVRDGMGSRYGTAWSSNATHGIYIDDQSEDVKVAGNTVVNVSSYGIFLHNTRSVDVTENTVASARESQIAFVDDNLGSYTVSETTVRDNVFVASTPGALAARASTTGSPALLSTIGTMTGNRYCAPFTDAPFGSSLPGQPRLLASQWQRIVGTDTDAQFCPQRFALFTDVVTDGPNKVANGSFDRDISTWFGWPSDALKALWSQGRLELRHTANAPIIHYDAPVGAIEKGRVYRVRFQAGTDGPDRWMRVYLRKWDPDYRLLGDAVDVLLGDQPRNYEFLIPATQDEERSLLIFELPLASKVVWLDNVSAEPVRALALDPSDMFRIETNPTSQERTLMPGENWTTVSGQPVPPASPLTVAPWRSVILLRDSSR